METIWNRLERIMYQHKYTSRQLAEELGIGESTVSMWWKNKTIPRADDAVKIAKIFSTTVEFLITGEYEKGINEEQWALLGEYKTLDNRDKEIVRKLIAVMIGKAGKEHLEHMQKTPAYKEFLKKYPPDQPTGVYEPEPGYPQTSKKPEGFNNVISADYDIVGIPYMGDYASIAAGPPKEMLDDPGDYEVRYVSRKLLKGDPKNCFCLPIRGTSMTEAGISDGDVAVLRVAKKPEHGAIMLIQYDEDGRTTLKRIIIKQSRVFLRWEDGSEKEEELKEGYKVLGKLLLFLKPDQKKP